VSAQQAYLGGGCFWCLEAVYQRIKGASSVVSGYAGGEEASPSYEQVSSGNTGHAEVVQIEFDPAIISYAQILDVFWAIHDPTTMNRQGNDVGSQYRSIILYVSDEQKSEAEKSFADAQKLWDNPVVTEITALGKFYKAEDYHQNYFNNHPEAAYCQAVINPKLSKLQDKFQTLLKP
jgi:peptide-methionine (S)-S-oxide reductase